MGVGRRCPLLGGCGRALRGAQLAAPASHRQQRVDQPRGRWARAAGLLFADALLIGAAGLLLVAAGLIPILTPSELARPFGLVGVGLTIGGLVLAWAAQVEMGDSWRVGVHTGESTGLVTGGVFGAVRNPIFTAMIIAQAGTVLMAVNWVSLAALAALVMACQLQVRRVEEPHLAGVHGQVYLDYRSRTGRFIPGWGRSRLGGQST